MSTWDEAILNALPGRMQPVTRSVNVSRHSNAAFTKGCQTDCVGVDEQPIVGRYVDVDERVMVGIAPSFLYCARGRAEATCHQELWYARDD